MGELAASATPEEELVSIGLGSCVGVALVDAAGGVAGLAHVMLPEANAAYSAPAKFADRAVPTLLASVERLGAHRTRLGAVLVGGAQMFGGSERTDRLDLGMRNEAAVRAALERERIPVRATATGGNRGRTIRVLPGHPAVMVKEAGGTEVELWGTAAAATPNDVPQALGWVRERAI